MAEGKAGAYSEGYLQSTGFVLSHFTETRKAADVSADMARIANMVEHYLANAGASVSGTVEGSGSSGVDEAQHIRTTRTLSSAQLRSMEERRRRTGEGPDCSRSESVGSAGGASVGGASVGGASVGGSVAAASGVGTPVTTGELRLGTDGVHEETDA